MHDQSAPTLQVNNVFNLHLHDILSIARAVYTMQTYIHTHIHTYIHTYIHITVVSLTEYKLAQVPWSIQLPAALHELNEGETRTSNIYVAWFTAL